MISQSLYHYICEYIRNSTTPVKDDLKPFLRPYILIIHRPSGRGFYLDQNCSHILDVRDCQEPENPVRVARRHLGSWLNTPAWVYADDVDGMIERTEFDTFWLF